jgi:hypothetical protein
MQRRKEEEASTAAAERRAKEEQERNEKDAAARAAAEREAKQKQDEEKHKKEVEARSAAQKVANEYITAGHERIARLEAVQAISHEISDMVDPAVKRLRVDIKKQVRKSGHFGRGLAASPNNEMSVLCRLEHATRSRRHRHPSGWSSTRSRHSSL